MELISPICDEKVNPHLGKLVCVVLKDETPYYGYLGGIKDGKLILNETPPAAAEPLSTKARKNRTNMSKKSINAHTSGFANGFGFGFGGTFAIDLALISLLFLIPLFFI